MTTELVPLPTVGFEGALVKAVRDRLRALCQFDHTQCDIEHDVQAPATQGHFYVVVSPAGIVPGHSHQPEAGVVHWIVTVAVTVAIRIGNVAFDRRRVTYADNYGSLDSRLDQLVTAIGNGTHVENAANVSLDGRGAYIEGVRVTAIDAKPQAQAIFGENATDPVAAMVRGFRLTGSYMREF